MANEQTCQNQLDEQNDKIGELQAALVSNEQPLMDKLEAAAAEPVQTTAAYAIAFHARVSPTYLDIGHIEIITFSAADINIGNAYNLTTVPISHNERNITCFTTSCRGYVDLLGQP